MPGIGRVTILLTVYAKAARCLFLILLCITSLVLLTSCWICKEPSGSIRAFSFLHEPADSHKLIVFVHGFTGDPSVTWTNQSGVSWADLIKEDVLLSDFTIWAHQYDTPCLGRSLTIEQTATRLLQQLKDEGAFDRFKEIYFVAHSMGGLVVKRVLVALNRTTQIKRLEKIKAVLLISTPSQGSSHAQLVSLLSLNPQVRDMKPLDLNSYLPSIENQWHSLMQDRGKRPFPKSYVAYETKPTWGIVIVDRVSALTSHDDEMFPIAADHQDIVKPRDAQSDIYRWVRSRLLETSGLVRSAAQAAVSVQVAPRVLHYVHRFKSGAKLCGRTSMDSA